MTWKVWSAEPSAFEPVTVTLVVPATLPVTCTLLPDALAEAVPSSADWAANSSASLEKYEAASKEWTAPSSNVTSGIVPSAEGPLGAPPTP